MDKRIYQNYLLNLMPIIKKQAEEAKRPKEKTKDDIAQGVLMGYYSIIILFKHQAFTFCIDQKEIGLAEIKPDIDYVEDNRAIDEMPSRESFGTLAT